MITIRAKDLTIGQYIWSEGGSMPILIQTLKVTPRGKIDVGFKRLQPEQKVLVFTQSEIDSWAESINQAKEDLRDCRYKDWAYEIENGVITFKYVFRQQDMEQDRENERRALELNLKLKQEKALTVGELMDYLSGFAREDKVKFLDDDGDFHYLDKNFDWLLAVERASKKNDNGGRKP